MKWIVFVGALLVPAFALAQQMTPIDQDAISLQASMRHLFEDAQQQQQQLSAALKSLADTQAYWKSWCDSAPGCATPAVKVP